MKKTFVRISFTLIGSLALGCASAGSGKTEAPNLQDLRPALIVFTKPGCPACLKLAPALAKIKKDYAPKVRFEEVDTAVAKKLIFEYEISLTPTVILFVDGEEDARLLNPQPAEVRAAIDKALAAKS
jgi:thiol-disulfide isomerase/thioredoxin